MAGSFAQSFRLDSAGARTSPAPSQRARALLQRLALAFSASLALHLATFVWLPSLLSTASRGNGENAIHLRLTASVRSATPAAAASVPGPSSAPAREPDPERARTPVPAFRPPAVRPPEPDLPDYLKPAELDQRAAPLGEIVLDFPEDSDAQLFDGTLTLRVFIDEHGVVQRVVVEDAVPAGYFESSAIAAFLAARFQPATRAGVPVRSQMRIEVSYRVQP